MQDFRLAAVPRLKQSLGRVCLSKLRLDSNHSCWFGPAAKVVRFINALTYFTLRGRPLGQSGLIHEFGQILARELPFEWPRVCFP